MAKYNPDEALCLTGAQAAEVRVALAELAGGCPRCTHGLNSVCTCALRCETSDCQGEGPPRQESHTHEEIRHYSDGDSIAVTHCDGGPGCPDYLGDPPEYGPDEDEDEGAYLSEVADQAAADYDRDGGPY